MKLKRNGGEAGFTLVELMVAVLLLLIVMAGFLPVFLQGLSQSSAARFKSMATNIAREKIERIRQLDYREIFQDNGNLTDSRNLSVRFGSAVVVPERNTTFRVTYVVADSPVAGESMKSVQVTVDWAAPPRVSPAILKTLVAQQYLGPRGARLEVDGTAPDKDPPSETVLSPFLLLPNQSTAVRYYLAEADWFMAYLSLNPLAVPQDISLTSLFRDDTGAAVGSISVPNAEHSAWGLKPLPGAGPPADIWFNYEVDASTIPDGYWDLQVTMYNSFDEPGNTWDLRVRVEKGPPAAPEPLLAQALSDTQINLSWSKQTERDRVSYILQRMQKVDDVWTDWETLVTLPPDSNSYPDDGVTAPGLYRYRIYGADTRVLSGFQGPLYAVSNDETTPPLVPPSATAPVVTTAAAATILSSSALSGGNVISDGGAAVTARGVCWGTSPNPSSTRTNEGIGTGSFTSTLTGLSPSTTYHYRAYATNSAGTSYGADLTFTTLAPTPLVLYTVTFNTADTNNRKIVVKHSDNTALQFFHIKSGQTRTLELSNDIYGVFIGDSPIEFSSFVVNGGPRIYTIP